MQGKKTKQATSRPIRILKANIYSYMVTIIFLLITALLMTYTDMGIEKERWIILLGVVFSSFIAGSDTARGENRNGWKWGICGSAVYAIIYFMIAILTAKRSLLLSTNSLVMLGVMLCSGAVGGMIAINMKK